MTMMKISLGRPSQTSAVKARVLPGPSGLDQCRAPGEQSRGSGRGDCGKLRGWRGVLVRGVGKH